MRRVHDASVLSDYGDIESLRAARFHTCFSLVLIGLDGGGQEDLESAGESVKRLIRSCDVAGIIGRQRLAVILPETDFFGALMMVRKLTGAAKGIADERGLKMDVSHATFPIDGRSYQELLGSAERRARENKLSLWEKLGLRERLYWEIVDDLFGSACKGSLNACFDTGQGHELSEFFTDQVNDLIMKEVRRSPHKRGLVYFSVSNITSLLPIVKAISLSAPFAARVFVTGECGESVKEIKNATPICLDDGRLKETFFTFFLSEDSSYALICRESWGAGYACFHTSDPYLVHGLINKFQKEYSLQETLG
ncbi:MAG: hypothetical protein HZB83_02095 [Deltaproteobacteria bacterium]|nr:hypothetical protein [Deltaproteobacteria bacterium]